jgi:hypothetical protein
MRQRKNECWIPYDWSRQFQHVRTLSLAGPSEPDLLYDLIRAQQQRRRDGKAERLRGL